MSRIYRCAIIYKRCHFTKDSEQKVDVYFIFFWRIICSAWGCLRIIWQAPTGCYTYLRICKKQTMLQSGWEIEIPYSELNILSANVFSTAVQTTGYDVIFCKMSLQRNMYGVVDLITNMAPCSKEWQDLIKWSHLCLPSYPYQLA